MRKITYLLLCAVVFIAATAAKPFLYKRSTERAKNNLSKIASIKNMPSVPAPSASVTAKTKVVGLVGKMVNGKLVIKKPDGYVYQPNTFYVVFVWQVATGGYDLRLQEAKYDPVLSIIATTVPVDVTANVTGVTSYGSQTSNVTIPANTYQGVVDLGVYPSTTDPTLTTNSVSPGTVNVGGVLWPVVNIQFPADIHP
jgi:hypothetical protein